ncbi:pyrophosphatase PpaX [Lentibacillus cibarius]|uniref:Pyrophosphatase PpaX n=1 Tax=Lentibacillus cibarius TaxID=2583219 RepID=A0A549YML1_9BACI|nr:pyrophosphatase PpaX [Lentibacillus cibarius]TRM13121.1 pyrophosphatase PpaX [Lentibacillus cibarius]
MNIHTVLFDLDGTLIDTNELIIESFIHTFQRYGKKIAREEAIEFIGPPLKDTFLQYNPVQAESMMETYREHNKKHHDDYVTAFPNVLKTIDRLYQKNIQLGIVTTKLRGTVGMGLRVTQLDSYFKTVITLDDVACAKPHPEPVIRAMNELGASPESTLMVGDNSHDIEAGKNAAVKTAAVSWSLKDREKLLAYKPTYMLDDMQDLLTITEV